MNTIAGIGGERYWVHIPRQNSRPRAYRDGGLVAAAAAVKGSPLANKYGDTELVHVNKYEMEKLREMWGEPGINPETGLPAYGLFSFIGKALGAVAKIAGTVLLTPVIGPVGAAAAVSAVSGIVEGKSVGDIVKGAGLSALTAGAGQLAGQVLPGAVGIGKDVAQAIGSGLGSAAGYAVQGVPIGDALMGGLSAGIGTYGANKLFDTVVDKNILGLGDAAKFLYGTGQDVARGLGINDSISGIGKNWFGSGVKAGPSNSQFWETFSPEYQAELAGTGPISGIGELPATDIVVPGTTVSSGVTLPPAIEVVGSRPTEQVTDNTTLPPAIEVIGTKPTGPTNEQVADETTLPPAIEVIGTKPTGPTNEQVAEDVTLPPAIEVIGTKPVKDQVVVPPPAGGGGTGGTGGGGTGGGNIKDNVTIYKGGTGGGGGGSGDVGNLTPMGGLYDTGPRSDIFGARGIANINYDPFTYGQATGDQPGEYLFFTQGGQPYGLVGNYNPAASGQGQTAAVPTPSSPAPTLPGQAADRQVLLSKQRAAQMAAQDAERNRILTAEELAGYAPLTPIDKALNDALMSKAQQFQSVSERYMKDYGLTNADLKRMLSGSYNINNYVPGKTFEETRPLMEQYRKDVTAPFGGMEPYWNTNLKYAISNPYQASSEMQEYINDLAPTFLKSYNEAKTPKGKDVSSSAYNAHIANLMQMAGMAPPAAAPTPDIPFAVPAMKDGGEAADDEGGLDMVRHLVAWQKGGGHQGPGQVKGIGSGQEDKIPAWLSDGEYVWSAQDVSDLGDGSTDEGVRRLDQMRQMVRRRAGRKDVKKIAKPQQGIETMLKAVGGRV